MNQKTNEFHKIVDIVVECCQFETEDREVIKEKLIGTCREENIVMMRCVLARTLAMAGFTNITIATILHRNIQTVRHLLELARDFRSHNRIYRLTEEQTFKEYFESEEQ